MTLFFSEPNKSYSTGGSFITLIYKMEQFVEKHKKKCFEADTDSMDGKNNVLMHQSGGLIGAFM